MDAELALLVACCRCSFSEEAADELHGMSTQVDWPRLLRLSCRHRVQGLVAQAFYKSRVSPPGRFAAEMASDAAAIAENNLRAARESIRLLERFGKDSIPLLFVKGLALSALAYGDPFIKMSADIDILVGRSDLEAAAAILHESAYRPVVPRGSADLSRWHRRHKESIWSNPDSGLVIELHTRLADHPDLIPDIGMSSPRQEVRIGPDGHLPTLGTDDLFAYLCVHGASSAWFRLKWIVDLAALVHAAGLEDLYKDAQGRGAGRAPAQALLLADRLSLLRLPGTLRRELNADLASRLLARIALAQLLAEGEPTRRPFGTASIHLSQPLLLPGWRFKFSEVARQAADIVAPLR